MQLHAESDVSNANISGAIHLNMEKWEQVWMPNDEYLGYYQNYWCGHAYYIDSHLCQV